MKKKCKSIYQQCRNNADISIDIASYEIGISERQLANYENLKCIPSDAVVIRMAEIYRSPPLKIEHLNLCSEIFREFFKVYEFDFPLSILLLEKEIDDLERLLPRVINELAEHGDLSIKMKETLYKTVNELVNTAICIMKNSIKKEHFL